MPRGWVLRSQHARPWPRRAHDCHPTSPTGPVMNAATVPSPCISVCQLDPESRRCLGCSRSIEQIEAWIMLDDRERMAVWVQLARHFDVDLETALASRVGPGRARELVRSHESG